MRERTMNVLCITDKSPDSDHSAVEGIFNGALEDLAEHVYIVYFSRKAKTASAIGRKIVLPRRYKRMNVLKPLADLINLHSIDVVVVRNFFRVLNTVLKKRDHYKFLVGFWESFPHNFRRIHQARIEHKHLFRKTIEYHFKRITEKQSIRKCDFYLPITETYKSQFYADIRVPFHPLPMGVDFSRAPVGNRNKGNPNGETRKFVYIGAVDEMRQLEVVVSSFLECHESFEFHLFTQSANPMVDRIRATKHPGIVVKNHLPRTDLFHEIMKYDVGIGLVPEIPLYQASSPTKTLEYYALGLPAVVNGLPEYASLFNSENAFFCEFTQDSITSCIERICRLPKEALHQMGALGRKRVQEKRDYTTMSEELYVFLHRQLDLRFHAENPTATKG